jgi:hypothetical protein
VTSITEPALLLNTASHIPIKTFKGLSEGMTVWSKYMYRHVEVHGGLANRELAVEKHEEASPCANNESKARQVTESGSAKSMLIRELSAHL